MKLNKSWLSLISFCIGIVSVSCSSTSGSTNLEDFTIGIDGSSTVYPITVAIAERYSSVQPEGANIEISFSGTGDGFEKFCNGETVVNNASRPISKDEMADCADAEIRYFELPVAFDAITIAVNPQNTWADDITTEELQAAWAEAGQRAVTSWQDIRSSWPNVAGLESVSPQFTRGRLGTLHTENGSELVWNFDVGVDGVRWSTHQVLVQQCERCC